MSPARRRSGAERYVAFAYVAAAVGLAAVLLPTVLRPPQDLQNTTAAFSPDAPPDETPPEALLQSVRQASSSTAGASVTEEVVEEVVVVEEQPPVEKKATRSGCFGDPPRQTESLYSALCVPAWTAEDNGGRTAPGVYPDEIRVAIAVGISSETPEGRLDREFDSDDLSEEHTLKVWQTYFNERFEFYGRYLQFYVVHQSTTNADQQRGTVQRAKDEWDVFAMLGNGNYAVNEAIRLGIIDFGSINNPVPFYNDAFPYAYAFYIDSWQTRYLTTELACKQFAGKPPGELNEREDPLFDYEAPRVWGLITYQDDTRTGAVDMYTDLMARCGVEFAATHEYNLTDSQDQIAGSMAKMRQNGVTTIILATDGLTPGILTNEAQRLNYFPEYIGAGGGGLDGNAAGRLMQDDQAEHFVGIAPTEIPRADADKDWYRAYKEIDPEGDPEPDFFRSLQQLSGGIQHAGTNLTPQTFWEGLKTQPYREPDPKWSIGGGYRESFGFIAAKDLTYMDYVSLIWFDNEGDDPDSSSTGAFCHVFEGERFRYGEMPEGPIPWFDLDECIHSPEKGVQG